MMRSSIVNKKTCITAVAVLALGFAGGLYAQSSSMSIGATGGAYTAQDNAGKKGEDSYNKKDNPTRGTKDTLGSDEPGSSGSGGSGSGGSKSPEGSAFGGSTGDKGFSNLRENKGGKGARGIMGGSTDTKAGHAGESIGSGGTGKSDKSKLDASAPADGSSEGIAK
jgi:hypothetical protein